MEHIFEHINGLSIHEDSHVYIFEANYRELPQVRIRCPVILPEKFLRRFTKPNRAQQVLVDRANCVEQEIIKFGQ